MATTEQIVKRLGKLQSTLLASGLQNTNQPLYQVINQLIQAVIDSATDVVTITGGTPSGGGGPLSDKTFLTIGSELSSLPNSSQLVAGDNVSFDTSVFGQLRIDVAGGGSGVHPEWSVLTNSDPVNPELIFAGGDVIMVHTP